MEQLKSVKIHHVIYVLLSLLFLQQCSRSSNATSDFKKYKTETNQKMDSLYRIIETNNSNNQIEMLRLRKAILLDEKRLDSKETKIEDVVSEIDKMIESKK